MSIKVTYMPQMDWGRSVMARRIGVLLNASKDLPPSGGQISVVTAEVRVHWPDNATEDDIEEVLQAVVMKTQDAIEERISTFHREASRRAGRTK